MSIEADPKRETLVRYILEKEYEPNYSNNGDTQYADTVVTQVTQFVYAALPLGDADTALVIYRDFVSQTPDMDTQTARRELLFLHIAHQVNPGAVEHEALQVQKILRDEQNLPFADFALPSDGGQDVIHYAAMAKALIAQYKLTAHPIDIGHDLLAGTLFFAPASPQKTPAPNLFVPKLSAEETPTNASAVGGVTLVT